VTDLKSKFICAQQPCGTHINPDHPHGVDPILLEGGWARWIDEVVAPEVAWMATVLKTKPRLLEHNPFSCRAGNYQFDQFIHAKNAGIKTATLREFHLWRNVTNVCEVIFYMGELHTDPDFNKKLELTYSIDNFVRRCVDSMAPIWDVGGSVALDMSNDWPSEDIQMHVIALIRAACRKYGGEVYLEPIPNAAYPHLFNYSSIITEALWRVRNGIWDAPLSAITGEIIRWVQVPDGGFGSVAETATRLSNHIDKIVRQDGHTFCGPTGFLREVGYQP
jgi:hypothetical protein